MEFNFPTSNWDERIPMESDRFGIRNQKCIFIIHLQTIIKLLILSYGYPFRWTGMNSVGRRFAKDPIKLNEKLLDILITNLNLDGDSKKILSYIHLL